MLATASDPSATKTARGQYLYAVIECDQDRRFDWTGIDGAAVRALSDGRVAAVVSEAPGGKLRPERRRLAAHHEALKRLRQEFVVLPVAFGLVADSPDAARDILVRNREEFIEQIRRVAGKVEMGLRACWDVPNIFEYFVETQDDLRELRDQLFRGRQPTKDEMIELGRTFDRLLGEQRAACTQIVTQALQTRSFEVKENKPRNEQEIMNLAFLIGEKAQQEFEDGVVEAARRFDNHFSFDFNGPWLPHNFVDLNLDI
ncbi:MAG TPA: GvpL/GvpF family gas vesicle protein [Pirellulales bacterium]|nr:GvpL/GvpF family gas vesicle protein [Pirellulales bacterium]